MNEPNPLETQLRSWTLRRPSDEIRRALFAQDAEATRAKRLRISFAWLTPVAACALTMLMVFGTRTHSHGNFGAPDTNLFFASISMNSVTSLNSVAERSEYNLSKTDLNLEQNVWRMATFESTNHGQSHSSMDSLQSGQTNRLMH